MLKSSSTDKGESGSKKSEKSDSYVDIGNVLRKVKSVGGAADTVWGFDKISEQIQTQPDSVDKQRKERALMKTERMYGAIVYSFFFVVFVVFASFIRIPSSASFFGSLMTNVLQEDSISDRESVWKYLNDKVQTLCSDVHNSSVIIEDSVLLLGEIELRQFRFGRAPCRSTVNDTDFRETFSSCPTGVLSQEPFGLPNMTVYGEKTETTYWGQLSSNEGAHNSVFLPVDLSHASEVLQKLKDFEWIDKYTKSLVIVVNGYNMGSNEFGQYGKILEQQKGVWYPSASFASFQVLHTSMIVSFVVYLVALLINLVVYLRKFLKKTITDGLFESAKTYFFTLGWETVDSMFVWMNFIFSCIWISFMVADTRFVNNINLHDPLLFPYETLDYLISLTCSCWIILAGCVVAFVIKSLHYFEANSYTAATFNTIVQAFPHIVAVLIVSGFVWISFALVGTILFSPLSLTWKNWIISFLSTWDLLTGSISLNDLLALSPILGPIFFISFTIVMTFVLLNMFVGIFNEFYTRNMVPDQPWKDPLTLEEKLKKSARQCMDYLTHSHLTKKFTPEGAINLLAFKTYTKLNLDSFEEELKQLLLEEYLPLTKQKSLEYFNIYLVQRHRRDLAGLETGDLLTLWNLVEAKLDSLKEPAPVDSGERRSKVDD